MVGEVTDSSYFKVFLSSVIPNNIIWIFISGNMLSILLVATTIGLGLAALPEESQMHFSCTLVKDLLNEFQEFFFLFVHYLVFILPFGIVSFTAQFITQIKAGIILGGIVQYFTAIIGSNIL